MTKADAVDKVRKLNRLAKGAGSPSEARAAGVRAAALRAKYAITDADLRESTENPVARDPEDLLGVIFDAAERIAKEKYNPYADPIAGGILQHIQRLAQFQRKGPTPTRNG